MSAAVSLRLQGLVQGCGVRPAIARLAHGLALTGWVENTGDHVQVHIQGPEDALRQFTARLPGALPPAARLDACIVGDAVAEPVLQDFSIRAAGSATALRALPDIPADRAICAGCLAELGDPQSRRYAWPFIACAACGPRYAWLQALPFARRNTTFSAFSPCESCATEQSRPDDKRFGMELIACPQCGPELRFVDTQQTLRGSEGIEALARCLLAGGIVALQGFCGFQLLALADNANAVARLRQFKARRDKPLAVLARSVSDAAQFVTIDENEREWLAGPHRPIVLLRRHDRTFWPWVAQDNPRWGIMLPAHGMHVLLFDALAKAVPAADRPVLLIATSANLRGEPLAAEVETVLPWLGKGIDAVCHHSVPVWQAQDDSVLAVLADGPLFFRRARGFAHEVLEIDAALRDRWGEQNVLGTGAFLKTTVALRAQERVLISQYLGDKESVRVQERMGVVTGRLSSLCGFRPDRQMIDAHPDALVDDGPVAPSLLDATPVFHHRAHVGALLAEHGHVGPALVAAWDGFGYGEDGQWWGSEVFALTDADLRPVYGLQPFALPGGDRCAREPWRVMVALLMEAGIATEEILDFLGEAAVGQALPAHGASARSVQRLVVESVQKAQAFPRCTSMGRFIEGIAALLLRHYENEHEAQAAMALEYAVNAASPGDGGSISLPVSTDPAGVQRWIWQPLVAQLWARLGAGESPAVLARAVLDTLAETLLSACQQQGVTTLGISGGCFQNLYWVEYLRVRCENTGIRLIRPQRFPPNDGAIALGQVLSLASRPIP